MNLFYPANRSSKACWVFDALKKGWPGCAEIENYHWSGGSSAFWGLVGDSFNLIKRHQKQSVPFLFTDMPYWNRFLPIQPRSEARWRIVPNALHCNWQQELHDDRLKQQGIEIRDWQTRGNHILVCPSSKSIEQFYNEPYWTEKTVETLKKFTDRPIKVRNKPRNGITSGPAAALVPIEDDLKNAHAIVTLVSIAAIDAIIMGIPSFASTFSPASPVSELDLGKIESPKYVDRTKWLNTLSYFQYSEDEIASGQCYDFLRSFIQR